MQRGMYWPLFVLVLCMFGARQIAPCIGRLDASDWYEI
jgi:hypothetical protein